jgi:hypothetical protein
MSQTLFDRYAENAEAIDACEAELKRLKAERLGLEDQMLRVFEESGECRYHTPARTIFLRRDLYLAPSPGAARPEMAVEVRRAGLPQFVSEKLNESDLARYIDERDLGSQFRTFRVAERYLVRTRRRTNTHE